MLNCPSKVVFHKMYFVYRIVEIVNPTPKVLGHLAQQLMVLQNQSSVSFILSSMSSYGSLGSVGQISLTQPPVPRGWGSLISHQVIVIVGPINPTCNRMMLPKSTIRDRVNHASFIIPFLPRLHLRDTIFKIFTLAQGGWKKPRPKNFTLL